MPRTRLTVVVAEDSVLLREGLTTILVRAGHDVVASVGDGAALLAAVDTAPPDVVLTDVRMPPDHADEGLRAAATIRERYPQMGIVVLSQYVADAYTTDLIQSTGTGVGGVGYLLKQRVGHVAEFLDSLQRVAEGGTVIDPEVVRQLLARRHDDGPVARLSPREYEVLGLMAQGMTNPAIADALVVSETAVRKHVGNIFAKLSLEAADGDRRVLAVLAYLRE